jgi:hypothetical protein
VKLVVLEQGFVRAVLVADTGAAAVEHHAVVHPEAIIQTAGGIVVAPNIAPDAVTLLIVHKQSTCFVLVYALDGRSVEADRSRL